MKGKKPSPVWWIAGGGFAVASLACWIGFQSMGTMVDTEGMVREPFALLPLGYFFAMCAVASLAVGVAGTLAAKRR